MSRVSIDDLEQAAMWLDAYEAEDGHGARDSADGPYTGTDDVADRIYRVADWMRAEVAKRQEEALIREVTQQHVAQTGRKPTRAQVRAAIQTARDRTRKAFSETA